MERIGRLIVDIHRENFKESQLKKTDKENTNNIDSKDIHKSM